MRTHTTFKRFLIASALFATSAFALSGAARQQKPPDSPPAASQPAKKWSSTVPPAVTGNVHIALKDLREMGFEVAMYGSASDYFVPEKLQSSLTKVLMNEGTPWTVLNQDQYIARFRQGSRLPMLQLAVQLQAVPSGEFVLYNLRLSLQELATTARQPDIAIDCSVWQNQQVGFAPPDQVLKEVDQRIGMLFQTFAEAWVTQNTQG